MLSAGSCNSLDMVSLRVLTFKIHKANFSNIDCLSLYSLILLERRPALLDNILYTLVAPDFVVIEVIITIQIQSINLISYFKHTPLCIDANCSLIVQTDSLRAWIQEGRV